MGCPAGGLDDLRDERLVDQPRKAITRKDQFVSDHAGYSTDSQVLACHRREWIEALEQAVVVK